MPDNTDNTRFQEFYQALLKRDSQYVGVFFAAVKTTGVFCTATCRARKPKRENVEFFDSVNAALMHGYRPCKVCRPTEQMDTQPAVVTEALQLFHRQPDKRLSDAQLRASGLQPATVRRWFKRHMGLTFQAYQRMYRINQAYLDLKKGRKVIDSALDAGYDSLSGFQHSYKKLMHNNPREADSTQPIYTQRFDTPLGPMFACATDSGLCLLEFTDRRALERELSDIRRLLKGEQVHSANVHITTLRQQLHEYFRGERKHFDVPLETPGTPFQQQVWQGLLEIPYGATRSYGQQAEHLGSPQAVRAVARANGANRVSIVIPCHRVIGADGKLTGYGGGLARKQWLLRHEMQDQLFNQT